MLMLGVYSAPPSSGVPHLIDATPYLTACTLTTNVHGFEGLSAAVRQALRSAFQLYDQPSLLYVGLFWNGQIVWEGRLEDPSLAASGQGSGLSVGALGAWRALSDLPYTALWSDSGLDRWEIQNRDIYGTSARAERFEQDTNLRIYMTPKKNESFGNAPAVLGFFGYIIPDQSTRKIVGIQFDYDFLAPTDWRVLVQSRDGGWGTATATHLTLNGSGAVQAASLNLVITATDRLTIRMDFNAANAVYTGETGGAYIRITNMRLVTSTANRVNTTFTNNETAGNNVVIEVPSTANMYVGQRLIIASGSLTNSESVIVEAINPGVSFTADLALNHTAGQTIQAHVIYADEIVKDQASAVATLNSAQLSSSTALIQSPGIDLTDRLYEDAAIGDIISSLAALGDTSGALWESGVYEGRMLFFRPKGTVSRAWFVDATDLNVARSLEQLANSIYPVYADINDHTLRGAAQADSTSIARYGVTRRQALQTQTTIAVTATSFAATALADHKDPQPRASVRFDGVFDALGSRYPLWLVRTGDTITVRNLPPNLSATIDRIRTFRISHTSYDALTDTLTIEPETPPPTLEVMLARRAEGVTS